jgi:hypothetical protein
MAGVCFRRRLGAYATRTRTEHGPPADTDCGRSQARLVCLPRFGRLLATLCVFVGPAIPQDRLRVTDGQIGPVRGAS